MDSILSELLSEWMAARKEITRDPDPSQAHPVDYSRLALQSVSECRWMTQVSFCHRRQGWVAWLTSFCS